MRALTNTSGTVTDTKSRDAFGIGVTTTGSTPTPFGFAGQFGYQQDSETGLMRLGHRMYDASTGRFISRDPIQDGYNWYAYCENDPIDSVDMTGNDFLWVGWTGSFDHPKATSPINTGILVAFDDYGYPIWWAPINSGGHGNGPTPRGTFTLSEEPFKSSNPKGTGGWFTPIDPQFDTPRTDMRIHFDGNVPGTLGCIGFQDKDDYKFWLKYIHKQKPKRKKNLFISMLIVQRKRLRSGV